MNYAIKKPTPAFQTKQTQTTKKECINYDGYIIMMNVFFVLQCKFMTFPDFMQTI